MTVVAGAVLAAGLGTRMGGPKAELQVSGARLIDRAVETLAVGGCHPIIAVVPRHTQVSSTVTIENPDPSRGMRSSLALAIDAAQGEGVEGLALTLVDTGSVTADAVRQVIAAWVPGRIARASYGGQPGHPMIMSLTLWREALRIASPDEGARQLLRQRPELVDLVEVDGSYVDLDTVADVSRWERENEQR